MLAPVAGLLAEKGYDVGFFALTTAKRYLDERGINSFGYADFFQQGSQATEWAHEKALEYAKPGGPVSLEESIAYHRVNLAELAMTHGEQEAERRFQAFGRQSFLPIKAMQEMLAQLRPRLVVATNSPRTERALVSAAGNLGIPAICVVDLFALQEVAWIGAPNYAQKICVINDEVRAMFIARGRSENEVVVTGNPAFDKLFDPDLGRAGRAMRLERGWTDDRKTILWASQIEPQKHPFTDDLGDPSLPRRVEKVLREFVRDSKDHRLVVRYHPSEQIAFEPDENVFFSPTTESLPALLHAVDIVVVTASTVGIEAHLIGKPVISVDCTILQKDAPFAQMGISVGVPQPEDLPRAIRRVAGTEVLANASLGGPAASATENVARTIIEFLKTTDGKA